tara:strand:- start:1406 stop:1912 length:507 start_codon:yes stop_codon:yes gene_type:complete
MARPIGSTLTPAQLAKNYIQKVQGKFIWNKRTLKANDIIQSFQNIDTPINHQPAHETLTAAATLTPTILKKGIITIAPDGANDNLTLSGTTVLIDGLFKGTSGISSQQLYDMWTVHIINLDGAAQTATLAAADGDTVVVGNAVIAAGTTAQFDISLTATNALTVLRAN